MKIIGSYVCPYVRKVTACLALKGLDYEIDPITPFFGGEEFDRLSPLRRIPVLVHDDLVLCDSTVICAWLDEACPGPSSAPRRSRRPRPRALARGICRHAARRRLHLGAVLPEDRPPRGLGRAGRRGADREDPGRGRARRARLSRRPAAGRGLAVRRDRPRRHRHRQLLPQRRLCRLRARPRALAAHRRLRRSRPRPSLLRGDLQVRKGAAVDQPPGPPPGPARRRRAAGRRERRHPRAAQGHHDALVGSTEQNRNLFRFPTSYVNLVILTNRRVDHAAKDSQRVLSWPVRTFGTIRRNRLSARPRAAAGSRSGG